MNMFRYIKYMILCLVAVATTACAEEEYWDEKPLHSQDESASLLEKEETSLRLVQYNVGAFSKSGSSSLDMVAAMMTELEADVVALNEVDSCTTRTGKVQQASVFADRMGGWKYNFSKAVAHKGGSYGVASVWNPKFQAVRMHDVKLPQAGGQEPRALCVVEFDKFIFATTHLDLTAGSQLEQLKVINTFFSTTYGATAKPIFITGDFNSETGSDTIKEMLKTWKLISTTAATFSSTNPKKCIDFIFVKPNGVEVTVQKTGVPRAFSSGTVSTASDHLPVFVDVTF